MNKVFWDYFKHFGRLLEKKLSVPHSQQDRWKSSQPATLQPATWLTGNFHRAQFRSWVVSNPYKQPVAAILDFKSPLTPWIIFFPATLSFQGLLFLPHLPASKNLHEEQIFWGTDPLGAPVNWDTCYSTLNWAIWVKGRSDPAVTYPTTNYCVVVLIVRFHDLIS